MYGEMLINKLGTHGGVCIAPQNEMWHEI